MARTTDESWAVDRSVNSINTNVFHESVYFNGFVRTAQGVVEVYSQPDPSFTTLTFTMAGRTHRRTINGKHYRPRGLVTQANRYAAEFA